MINPLDINPVVASVIKTGKLVVIDGGWSTCGLAGEIIAAVAERVEPEVWKSAPRRLTLQDAPAPSSRVLESNYYPTVEKTVRLARQTVVAASRMV